MKSAIVFEQLDTHINYAYLLKERAGSISCIATITTGSIADMAADLLTVRYVVSNGSIGDTMHVAECRSYGLGIASNTPDTSIKSAIMPVVLFNADIVDTISGVSAIDTMCIDAQYNSNVHFAPI
jgi:hypothetical protein